jgi:hypothetical protein
MSAPEAGEIPALPVTFRPLRATWMLAALAITITVCLATLAIMLPGATPSTDGFTTIDRVGFAVLILMILLGLGLLARPCVRADDHGLEIVNVMRRHRLAWAQVIAVRMRPGDAWLVLDLDDGSTLNAMGIQAADGERAQAQARQVAALVAARSATQRDD